jgi:hypothetical protein
LLCLDNSHERSLEGVITRLNVLKYFEAAFDIALS